MSSPREKVALALVERQNFDGWLPDEMRPYEDQADRAIAAVFDHLLAESRKFGTPALIEPWLAAARKEAER